MPVVSRGGRPATPRPLLPRYHEPGGSCEEPGPLNARPPERVGEVIEPHPAHDGFTSAEPHRSDDVRCQTPPHERHG